MTTSRLRAAVALLLITSALAACGEDGPSGPSFDDSVSTSKAQTMAQAAGDAAFFLAYDLNFQDPSYGLAAGFPASAMGRPEVAASRMRSRHLRPLDPARLDLRAAMPQIHAGLQASTMDENCTYTGHGLDSFDEYDPTDENENGVADDMLYEYKCTEPGAEGEVYTWGLRVTIKERDDALFGFTLRWRFYDNWDNDSGDFERTTYEQATDVDIRAGKAEKDQSFKYTYVQRTDGVDYVEGYGDSWNGDFDPDDAIALGSPLPNGDLRVAGRRFDYETGDAFISFEVSTPTVIRYNAACALAHTDPPFDSGVLHGELNGRSGQASFDVTWTSCGNKTVEVDGAFDEPMEAVAGR